MCERHSIPTAAYESFKDAKLAKEYIEQQRLPIVIKADGLAAGKGVIIAHSREEAFKAIDDILLNQVFGAAGMSFCNAQCNCKVSVIVHLFINLLSSPISAVST